MFLDDLLFLLNFLKIISGLRASQMAKTFLVLLSKVSKISPKLFKTSGLAFLSRYVIA